MIKITLRVEKQGDIKQVLQGEIRRQELFRKKVILLAKQTRAKMVNIIKSQKKRPQAGEPFTLEENIQVDKYIDNKGILGIGVGKIDDLNSNAPYWRAVDKGSGHIVGKMVKGLFRPGPGAPNAEDFRKGRIKTDGDTPYFIKIKKPIPPMRYIDQTLVFVGSQFKRLITRLK